MKTDSSTKHWEKTRLSNWVRLKNGRYYARLFPNGKEIWEIPQDLPLSVAEARLTTAVQEHREPKRQEANSSKAKKTFGEAAQFYFSRLARESEHQETDAEIAGSLKA